MQGDFSVLNFDPHLHERPLEQPADGQRRKDADEQAGDDEQRARQEHARQRA